MHSRSLAAASAALFCLAAIAAPVTGHAADVGYWGNCYGEDLSRPIAAAGHSPVAISAITTGELAGLAALVVSACGSVVGNEALTTAVANGMALIAHDSSSRGGDLGLPGMSGVSVVHGAADDQIDFPAGSPVLTGPGGTLTNASLDGGDASTHGTVPRASLPAGSQVLATTPDINAVATFSYLYGKGRVIYSTIPLGCYLVGGNCERLEFLAMVSRGMQAYATNVIAWAAGPAFTSCAAEGYAGAKLTLCRQVCEIDQTPSKLTSLIKTYMAIYRSEPPCAR